MMKKLINQSPYSVIVMNDLKTTGLVCLCWNIYYFYYKKGKKIEQPIVYSNSMKVQWVGGWHNHYHC